METLEFQSHMGNGTWIIKKLLWNDYHMSNNTFVRARISFSSIFPFQLAKSPTRHPTKIMIDRVFDTFFRYRISRIFSKFSQVSAKQQRVNFHKIARNLIFNSFRPSSLPPPPDRSLFDTVHLLKRTINRVCLLAPPPSLPLFFLARPVQLPWP